MTSAEAVEVVHQMMDAREREQENIAAEKQKQLGKNIKQLALPEATKQIVDEIVKLIR